jgi:hypothetical protein
MEKKKGNIKTKSTAKKSKKMIVIYDIISILLQVLLAIILIFVTYKISSIYKNKSDKKSKELNNAIAAVKNEIKELDEKSFLTKKYIELWNVNISDDVKKMKGIDIEAVEVVISDVVKKNYITNIQTIFSTPSLIPEKEGQKNKKKLDIVFETTELTIKFNSLTEYPLYYLIRELDNSKSFFYDIEKFSVRKVKNLTKATITNIIKNNQLDYILEIELKLHLYSPTKYKGAA